MKVFSQWLTPLPYLVTMLFFSFPYSVVDAMKRVWSRYEHKKKGRFEYAMENLGNSGDFSTKFHVSELFVCIT